VREFVFHGIRLVGRMFPVPVLYALLYPFAFLRALAETPTRHGRRPPASLPPGSRPARFEVDLRERTHAWLNTAALLWADRFCSGAWAGRIESSQLEDLRAILATRPAIVATVHFGGIFVLPSLLRAAGIPTAAAVGDKLWPVRWWRERRALLTQIDSLPAHLRSGDARSIVRYLQPGRCLLVALDYPLGDDLVTSYGDAALRLYTPSFRLARMTNAAIVPVLVRVDGPWRFSVRVGAPVPTDFVARGEDAAAVAHIVRELLPIAATRPGQALPLLVNAFERGARA
jgi:lauroyl/myristoyl acyltransferase